MAKPAEDRVMANLEIIEKWAFQGMTEKDMADCLEIGYSTFRKIKRRNVALSAILEQRNRLWRDRDRERVKQVEKSLYERAKGYDYDTIENIKIKNSGYDERGKKWEREEVIQVPKKVHVPADIQAAKFYLLNKSKKEWKENPHKVDNDRELLQLKKKEAEAKEW
jgi:hypothetical protein